MSLHKFVKKSVVIDADTSPHGFRKKGERIESSDEFVGVHLLDFSQIVISTINATFKPTDTIDINVMRHIILNTVRSNCYGKRNKYDRVVLCFDNANGGYWRRRIASYYKKSRKADRDKSGYDWESIFKDMETIKNEIKDYLPYIVMDINSFEADDHIAVLSKHITDSGMRVMITSSDGDFCQLHNKLVKQWSPMQKKWVKVKHGSARRDLLFKVIKGDKKDGISAISQPNDNLAREPENRVRAKSVKAADLEMFLETKDEDFEKLLDEERFIRYEENRELLDFEMIPDDIKKIVIDEYENYKVNPKNKMMGYFASADLKQLAKHIHEF